MVAEAGFPRVPRRFKRIRDFRLRRNLCSNGGIGDKFVAQKASSFTRCCEREESVTGEGKLLLWSGDGDE